VKSIRFRFELSWLKHADFIPLVREIWDKHCHADTTFDRIQIKLKRFKKFFKGWRFNLRGNNIKIKEQLEGELCALEQLEEDEV
jgi:hypothetical protein